MAFCELIRKNTNSWVCKLSLLRTNLTCISMMSFASCNHLLTSFLRFLPVVEIQHGLLLRALQKC